MRKSLLSLVVALTYTTSACAETDYNYEEYTKFSEAVANVALCAPLKEARDLIAATDTARRAWADMAALRLGMGAADALNKAYSDGFTRVLEQGDTCNSRRAKSGHEFIARFNAKFNHASRKWDRQD